MLPFATRTDVLDALRNKDVKIATVEGFLHSLDCEHGLPNVRNQLRRLWTKYVHESYSEEEDADNGESARIGTSTIRSKALTPPPTPPADGGGDCKRWMEDEISIGHPARPPGWPGGPGPISHVLAGCFVCRCKVVICNK